MNWWEIITTSYSNYASYLWSEITGASQHHYLYWLMGISVGVWLLELVMPWRKKQKAIRKDFWLDGFYMLFNYFLFSLVLYNALSNVGVNLFNNALASVGVENTVAINIHTWPAWLQLLFLFIYVDFISWNTHVLLHRVPFLWKFHKVHHSVREMGFAAHLRFHFVETIVYKSIQYIPVALIGFGLDDFFLVYLISLIIGHLNHANIPWGYGPLGKLLNNPKMHLWHHAKVLPKNRQYGVNFGISLSIWDYLFKTAYIPEEKAELELGFDRVEQYPKGFFKQLIHPFTKHG